MNEYNHLEKSAPKYVGVYTKILRMIQDGLYPEGSKIPPEPALAKKLGVSRMTLRQALELLQEDGVIETKHGLGNFVKKILVENVEGLEKAGNPMYKCLNSPIDKVTLDCRLDASDSYTNMIFHRETAAFLGITREYYRGENCIGFGFSYIPTDIPELQSVDLADKTSIKTFLDKDMYEKAHSGHLKLKFIDAKQIFKDEVNFASDLKHTLIIMETLFNSTGDILVYTKYSIPMESAELQINQYI